MANKYNTYYFDPKPARQNKVDDKYYQRVDSARMQSIQNEYFDKINAEWDAYENDVFANREKTAGPKDTSQSTIDSIWNGIKDTASYVKNEVGDMFGVGEIYKQSEQDYNALFKSNDIIQLEQSPNGFKLKHFDNQKLEELYLNELDKILPKHESILGDIVNIQTKVATTFQSDDKDKSSKFNDWRTRLFNIAFRSLLPEEKSERVSALIDKYLEVEEIGRTLQKRKELLGDDKNLLDLNKDKEGTGAKTFGAGLGGAIAGFIEPFGVSPNQKDKLENTFYNLFNPLFPDKTYNNGKVTVKHAENRENNYISWGKTQEAINDVIQHQISQMPEGEEKEKAKADFDQAMNGNPTIGYWEQFAPMAAELLGSVWSPGGNFNMALKGVNSLPNVGKAITNVASKWARAEKILAKNADKVEDLAKSLEAMPSMMNRGRLLRKGMSGKNLALNDETILSIKSFIGSGVESAAKMTIASGIMNALDQGMTDSEAWDATVNMGMLMVGNEVGTRLIARAARGFKLFNATTATLENPIAFARDMEKIYAGAAVAGQSLSQGTVNLLQGINPDQEEFWGEMLLNTIMAGKEFKMGYESARQSRYAKSNPEINTSLYDAKLVDENFDIGSVSDNAVFQKRTVVKPNGESEEMTFVTQRKDTPANIIEREARAINKELNELKPKDILELLPEQHKNESPEKQKFLEKALNKIGNVEVQIADIGADQYAKYVPKEKRIYFNNNMDAYNATHETVYSGLQEEVTHALTVSGYESNQKVREAIDRQYNKAKEKITPEIINEQDPIMARELEYYLSNPHEFMALMTNKKLKRTKDFVLSQLGANPTRGMKGALKRFISGDKYEQAEYDNIFNMIFDNIQPIEAPGQELNTNPIETMGQDINSPSDVSMEQQAKVGEFNPVDNPLDEFFLKDDTEYGNPLLEKINKNTDTVQEIKKLINDYNKKKNDLGFENNPTNAFEFINDAVKEYGKNYTLEDLKNVIKENTSRLEQSVEGVEAKFDLLKNIQNTDKEVYDKIIDNKIKLNEVFGGKNSLQILNTFAGESQDFIKAYIQDNIKTIYNDIPESHIDLISDNIAARLSQTREYSTLLLKGTDLQVAPSVYRGKPVIYFDTKPSGYLDWTKKFDMEKTFNGRSKELMRDLFSQDLQAIAVAERFVDDEFGGHYEDVNVNRGLEYILGNRKQTLIYLQNNLKKGFYLLPRGAKGLTVIESALLREIANDPKKANNYAKSLHVGNFYHHLDSDATWGYDPNRPDFNELKNYIKHSELHRQSVGGYKTDYAKLAIKPEYVDILKENADAIELLKTKTVQYYKDADNKVITIDHLNDDKSAILNLYSEITSTMQWGLDPSGESRTLKFNPQTGESKLKKLVAKYEGVFFGRHNGQINREEQFRKFLPDYETLTEEDLPSVYAQLGLHYENGELYQKTLILDPELFKDTELAFINDKSIDGAMLYTIPETAGFYNRVMLNPENSALTKPRLHYTDEYGNSLIIKSASFNLPLDKHTETNNPLYQAYLTNLSSRVGVVTFNSASKSGHTRRGIRVPSTIQEGSYLILNANRQIVNAETNGKADPELLKLEQERYKQNAFAGTIDDMFVAKIPLTGDNPLQLIDFSHSVSDFDDAGALGIDKNPLFHPSFELFQSPEGQEAFGLFGEMIDNVIHNNVSLMEDYALLRSLAINNGDEAYVKDLTDYQLKRAGKALKGLMKRIAKMKDSENSWDSINNIGLDNFKMMIADSIDKKGRLKKEMLLPLLTFDRLLTGQQGTSPGTGSLLLQAMKYAYSDAEKVRLPGRKGLVVPDLQSAADISRLAEYEAKKADNENVADNILKQAAFNIAEYTDPQTGVYKDYSLGVSLGKDMIESMGLKSGDKVFLKLTPSDDLHSIVPAVLTGMTVDGGIAFNTKYMTEIMGRDFDKDGLQVIQPGKYSERVLSDEKFEKLWNFYVKKGMHTGKYKKGNEKISDEAKTLINNRRLINDRFGYKKHRMFPQEAYAGVDFIQSHAGQGAGIGQRNSLGTYLLDFLPKGETKIIENDWIKITLGYPAEDHLNLAAEANILTQASVDTYDYQSFDRNYEYNKLFIQDITYKTGKKLTLNKNKLNDKQKEYVNQLISETIQSGYIKNGEDEIGSFINGSSYFLTKGGGEGLGLSSASKLANRLKKSNIDLHDLEKVRKVVLNEANNQMISKVTDYYKDFDNISQIKQVTETLLNLTENFYKPIKNTPQKSTADEVYINFKAFSDPKPKKYLQQAKGIFYKELTNIYSPHISNFIIDRINDIPVQYRTDGIKGYVSYDGKEVELSKIFSDNGVLQFTELLDSPRILDERLHKTLNTKGLSDSEKSRIMGKIIGNTAKLLGKYFKQDPGEIASIIAFTDINGTTLGLPNPDAKNAITGGRIPEVSNLEAGIRSMGVKPKIESNQSPQEYLFDIIKTNNETIYQKTKETEVGPISVQPEHNVAQVGEYQDKVLSKKNIFSVNPIKSIDKKASIKASIATQFIGFAEGIEGSSTELYRQQITKQENKTSLKDWANKTLARMGVFSEEILKKWQKDELQGMVNDLIEGRLKVASFAKEDLRNKQYLPFIEKLKENGFKQVKEKEWLFTKDGIPPEELYEQETVKLANSGNYSSDDVIFVSIGGKRGNEEVRKLQQDRTIQEAIKAIESGATLITDNKSYVESSDYNEGEKRLAENLENKGYQYSEQTIDGQVLGVWNKTQVGDIPNELGMPILRPRKAKNIASEVMDNIAAELNIERSKLVIHDIPNEQWDRIIQKVIKPDLINRMYNANIVDENNIEDFVNDAVDKLTSGAIDTYLQRKEYLNNLNNSSVKKDASGNIINSKAINFVNRTIKSQFLTDYLTEVERLSRGISDSKYAQFRLFDTNAKDIIINANATNIKAYNANDLVYPTFIYKNGEIEKQPNDITGKEESFKRYMTVGNLFDRKMQSNRLFQVASKDWVEKVLPLKRQGYINDSVKSLNTYLENNNVFSKTDLEMLDSYSNISKQYYYPDLQVLMKNIAFNRVFENEHKKLEIKYKDISVQDIKSKDVFDDILKEIKKDFINQEIDAEVASVGFEDDRASLFDTTIAPYLKSYMKNTIVFKQHADYVRAAKDNIDFISKARVTDPEVQTMLKQEMSELDNLINQLESPTPDQYKELTRKLKISDAEALDMIQTYVVNPREAALKKRDMLLEDLDFGKNDYLPKTATEEEKIQHEVNKALSRNAMGHLKTYIERAILGGVEPDYNTIINKKISGPTTIKDGLELYGRDPMETFKIMKDLVDHNNNEMGDWYRLLQELDKGGVVYWERMTGAERKDVHQKTVNAITQAVDKFKSQLSVQSKAIVYFGEDVSRKMNIDQPIPIENIMEIISPKKDIFDYSISNLNEKIHDKLMKATYSVQKAMNIEYAKSPDANQMVDNILLGEFVSATGGQFHYNKVHDRSSLQEFQGMVKQGKDVPLEAGKPMFALYLNNNAEIKQVMGRYVSSFRSPVYDKQGSIIDYTPYIVLLDNAGVTSRTYTMPYSRVTTMVSGDHHSLLMRKHNEVMKPAYEKFADATLPVLKNMTSQKEEVFETGKTKRERNLTDEEFLAYKGDILSEQSDLKYRTSKPSLNTVAKNILSGHMDLTVVSTYGHAGALLNTGIGLGALVFTGSLGGLGLAVTSIMESGIKYGMAYLGNIYGTSGAYRTMPYLEEQNMFLRGMKVFQNNFKYAAQAAGNSFKTKTGEIISGAKLAALSASNESRTQMQYLLGEDLSKLTDNNPWKTYKESRRLAKEKEALEEIERAVNLKHKPNEIDLELLKAGDRYLNKLISEVEKKGSEIEIIDGKVFIDGKGYKQYQNFKYNLLDIIKSYAMVKGKMANQELLSYQNALRNNEINAQDIIQYLRVTDNDEVIDFDHNTFADFLFRQTEIAIGYYDKTPDQRSYAGRVLNTYSNFAKESLMNATNYRIDRQARNNVMIEVMRNDKEFVDWLENKNGVPFADFASRNEKSQAAMEFMTYSAILGPLLWLAVGGVKSLMQALDVDEDETVRSVKDDIIKYGLRATNIDKTAMDLSALALTGATDLMIEPRGNSKKGSKEIMYARDIATRPGGYGQNLAIEMFTSLSIAGAWQLYTANKDEKWQRSADRTMQDQIINAKANATAFVLPGTKKYFKDVYKPEKEEKPKATRRKRIPKE